MAKIESSPLNHADLKWDKTGQPSSDQFGDVYFSKDDGLQESRYVFLQHNQLPERFAALEDGADFVVGETGFGTGLNFLACAALWSQSAPANAHLHYLSVEKYPLSHPDLDRALRLWPELKPWSQSLQRNYPPVLYPGIHALNIAHNVTLTLIIDEATAGLESLFQSPHPCFQYPIRSVDAWFLDGFAPSSNPDMWRPELFNTLQKLSAPGTTLSTFTCAGVVKRGLKAAGFELNKVPGYGRKREMLAGELLTPAVKPSTSDYTATTRNSTFGIPWAVTPKLRPTNKAVVIGAGIAGCQIAHALAQRNWKITVIDQQPRPAAEASGNPQGAVYAKLSHRREHLADFNLLAFQHALRFYRPLWESFPELGAQCGQLQLVSKPTQYRSVRQLLGFLGRQPLVQMVTAQQAADIAGVSLSSGGLYFPDAGWISPPLLCNHLLQHRNIECRFGERITSLDLDSASNQWNMTLASGDTLSSPTVVVCNANQVAQLGPTQHLPVKPVRGQISLLPASAETEGLRTIICGDSYITPAYQGHHCIGASYRPGVTDTLPSVQEHEENLAATQRQLPFIQREAHTLKGRAALRCTTPDYLPLVGPAPVYERYRDDYDLLRKNARASVATAGACWPGLYVSAGYGSRGLAYTPLCTQLLLSQIMSTPPPIAPTLAHALHPGRFWIRALGRGQL